MQITSTDKIEVLLGAAVNTNQLHLISSYNDITATSITPGNTVTTSVNPASVANLVPSPLANTTRQLRWASIYNNDVVAATVTIQVNYNGTTYIVFKSTLQPGDYIQYTSKMGWKEYTWAGNLKKTNQISTISQPNHLEFSPYTVTTSALALSTTYAIYLGRATNAHTIINLAYVITTALGATVSWAEAAIYKGKFDIGSSPTLTRCGFISTATLWLRGGGQQSIVIPVSGIDIGDDLWCVVGNSTSGANTQLRIFNVVDNLGIGYMSSYSTNRPSTNSTLTGGTVVTASGIPMLTWNGD